MDERGWRLFKRGYYLGLFPVAIVAVLLGWALELAAEEDVERFESALPLVTAGWLALLGIAFWTRAIARRAMEIVLCGGLAAFFLVRLAYALYVLEPDVHVGAELSEFATWIPAYLGLTFLWFGVGRGRTVAIAFMAMAVVVALPALLLGRMQAPDIYALSMLYLSGDEVLHDIAGLLQGECREADTVGRWGGEEFMAILPEIGAGEAAEVAERIRVAVAEHAFRAIDGITISIGVASVSTGDTQDSLVKRADQALYRAKEQGRNRVEVADPNAWR